jgi:trans-2,3-dihydro-3-hydroxyanthranilate isomerase
VARPLTWLDVFTATPMTGNGLAVVHDADDLGDAAMLAFARETDLSETTFVQTATEAGADYRNRIWTPSGELDFAGHPSVGTAVAVARARGDRSASYVQQTHAGLQPVDVRLDGARARASMLQGPAVLGDVLDAGRVASAAGLAGGDVDPGLPCRVASTGQPHVVALLRDRDALRRAAPDAAATATLLGPPGATVLYLAVRDEDDDGLVRARGFFLQDGGVREDPATGSAAGPLMAHLHVEVGLERMRVVQGVEMGRPSEIECAVEGDRVRVGGSVVTLVQGLLEL